MRKIDKTQILSTEYKKWEEYYENNGLPHPKYNSSSNEFYYDVVMNLLYCQNSLCAYTEVQLCPQEFLEKAYWSKGKYQFTNKAFNGQLEHFDECLKSKQNDSTGIKDWLWENLFVVDSDTNNRKGSKEVDYILKPDTEDYNEFELLDYDTNSHLFGANLSLPDEVRERINHMLNDILGINFPNLVDKRRNTIIKAIEYGIDCFEIEFPTAFEFYRKNLNANMPKP